MDLLFISLQHIQTFLQGGTKKALFCAIGAVSFGMIQLRLLIKTTRSFKNESSLIGRFLAGTFIPSTFHSIFHIDYSTSGAHKRESQSALQKM